MSTSRTKTARTAKTEAAIIEGLSNLVIKVPVAKISLSELAKQSGLTRSTVYNQITSISNAMRILAEKMWIEVEEQAGANGSVATKILRVIDWVATDPRIQGFRKHNPELFQEAVAQISRLDDDIMANRVTEILMRWSVAADIDTATTLTRWIATWAIEPGSVRERESASELFAKLLLLDIES